MTDKVELINRDFQEKQIIKIILLNSRQENLLVFLIDNINLITHPLINPFNYLNFKQHFLKEKLSKNNKIK